MSGPMENPNTVTLVSALEPMVHHYFTRVLQGLLPPAINPHQLRQVLDVNCRIGTWAIDFASAYPGVTVTGLDNNRQFIDLARCNAEVSNSKQVRFYEAGLSQSLSFGDEIFDGVHMRMLTPVFRSSEWPGFLKECRRVMKSAAFINLVSLSLGPSSSNAYQRAIVLVDQLLQALGYSFSNRSGTSSPGVFLCHLLREAEFANVTYSIRPVHLGGWENAAGRACCELLLNDMRENKPLFLEYKLISSDEFDTLIAQEQKDIGEIDFCATGALISVVATKQ